MKKLIAILFILICLFGTAYGESSATPTDLEEYEEYCEFEDDDWGYIDIPRERKVYIVIDKDPEYLGDEVTLIAVLVDFLPEDNVTFQWQYATENKENTDWIFIDDANEQSYTFILDEINVNYWYRVMVKVGE
jgi:hypothetical protein